MSVQVPLTAKRGDARLGFVLWVLMFSCAINMLDRQVINILAEPIKIEFGLSDSKLGLLTGFAFALFHASLTLPMATIADRSNRSHVVAGSMFVRNLATLASGLAATFSQILAARMATTSNLWPGNSPRT